ncbi:SIS domain-containing protein [Candidatus Poriferisodalis sp.]|uniref:SIS domain-containing protein n=1 Tax=Candidatus Poriferisodalis sp. TaxID=3101277 RepID=UPI003D0A5B28
MCGIVAVLGRRDDRLALEAAAVLPLLRDATALLGVAAGPDVTTADGGERDLALDLEAAAALLRVADDALRSLPGVRLLVEDAKCVLEIDAVLATLAAHIVDLDSAVDSSDVSVTRSNEPDSPLDAAGARVERINAALGELADHTFALRRDRLRMAREIIGLWGGTPPPTAVGGLWSIQVALSALDRLEVRGRDSAGLQVFVRGADLDTAINDGDSLSQRLADPLFGSGAVRATDNGLAFVYKTAAEIGELGDNTAALRAAIRDDSLLRWALSYDEAETIVLSHTRWASIGIVSEPNTHPLDAWPSPRDGADVAASPRDGADVAASPRDGADVAASPRDGADVAASPRDGAHVAAVLNGDVDNYADLLAQRRLSIAPEITTDAKVIPTMLRQALAASKRADSNATTAERLRLAFVDTVSTFDGSVAIAAHASDLPGSVALALRGSGQALYVGATDHAYVVASEPYGLVEECRRFVRLDGETPSNPANPVGSRGQVMLVSAPSVADDGPGAGPLVALQRFSYDGSELPLRHDDVVTAEITTRDIDRGDSPHFLLKEIREAPDSLRATLRGRIETATLRGRMTATGTVLAARLGAEVLPTGVRTRLRDGSIRRVVAIGQGTAAAATDALPHFFGTLLEPSPLLRGLDASATLATEFSGFGLRPDMSDTLVVAVSQSGTTTDTNRTVDLARARGAAVVAIVNRRGSDLTDRADGVLYTSGGRDVEMSVASTKAFYAQIAASALLASAIAAELRPDDPRTARAVSDLLGALNELPAALASVLAAHDEIARIARRHVGAHRHWAVVGNGPNRIASREVRIKLSELCYHAVAEDATEDKKHIDLSCEPLVWVCATGLSGSVATDAAKEIAIYRAHRATPIVVASAGTGRFDAAAELLEVPAVHPALDFVLATAAGHLFCYEAALAIDALAGPLREMRAATEALLAVRSRDEALLAVRSRDETLLAVRSRDEALLAAERREGPAGVTSGSIDVLSVLAERLAPAANRFGDGLRAGRYDGHLRAGSATRLGSVLRYATGVAPLDTYQIDMGKVGRPSVLIEDLTAALNIAIDELTRPVDTVKHQAKTVTVGISRADETLMGSMLVAAAIGAGAPRDRLSYAALRTLAALDPAVVEVTGWSRYRIEGEVASASSPEATIWLTDRGGTALGIESRTASNPQLRGSKHRAAYEREVTVARGSDGRSVLHIPETKDGSATGLTLLHCQFAARLPTPAMRAVLMGYRGRYGALADAVTESLPWFRDDLLGTVDVFDLLTRPVYVLAEHWLGAAGADGE